MSTGYKIVVQEALCSATFQVAYWVDLFARKAYRGALHQTCSAKGYARDNGGLLLQFMRNVNQKRKMKIKEIVLILSLMCTFISCNSNTLKTQINRLKQELPSITTNHIDNFNSEDILSVSSNILLHGKSSFNGNYLKLIVAVKFDSNSFNQIKRRIVKECKYISSNDTSVILQFDYIETEYSDNFYVEGFDFGTQSLKFAINNSKKKGSYVIPYFGGSDFYSPSTFIGLMPDFKLYLLESRNSKLLNFDLKNSNNYISEEWKNGYSKGFAINEKLKEVLYWTIVW